MNKYVTYNFVIAYFGFHDVGYILTREGIKPQPEKVSAILALKEPTNVKELRKLLGMVQYYRDMWEKRSHLVAPLTDLVGECGQTKTTKKNGTKKKPWYWNETPQESFDNIKKTLARETLLAYPNYSKVFEIYTDARIYFTARRSYHTKWQTYCLFQP